MQVERDGLIQTIDGFNQNTQSLLDAIYGGITDEQQLRNFLQTNSPLSNQVLNAYMDRYGVPAEYFRDVVYMNSVVDRELHSLLGQRIQDLPQTIADQIESVLVENPTHETLAETEARLEIFQVKRDLLFAQEVQNLFDQGQNAQALNQIYSDNSFKSKILGIQHAMENQDWLQAQSLLNTIETINPEQSNWKEALEAVLSIHSETRWPCQVTEEEKNFLVNIFESSNPGDIVYGYSKGIMRELNDYHNEMLLPQLVEIPRTRSMQFEPLGNFVKIYPNPASNYVLVDLEMEKDQFGQFTLFGLDGSIVKQASFNSFFGPGLVEIDEIARGVYTYEISISQTQMKTGKIILK
ncbi:MAG: hypothetical protein ACI84C_001085 [Flavobacteriales bacterium]